MSIHFRSRIVNSNANPTVAGLDSGWCCKTNTLVNSPTECVGGGYIRNATNNSQCISAGTCLTPQLAPSSSGSGACCYWKNNQGTFIQLCEPANSSLECYNKNEGESENLYSFFHLGETCENEGGNITCNGVKQNTTSVDCNPDDNTGCFDVVGVIGNCCIGTSCLLTVKSQCNDGVWIPPINGTVTACSTTPCSQILLPSNRTPPNVSSSEILQSTLPFKKIPEVGQFYQGGIYVGTYTEGSTVVYGNSQTGAPIDYTARGESSSRTWILIADLEDLPIYSFNTEIEERQTLLANEYDGLYNTVSNNLFLYDYIENYKSNGFTDWYVPSLDELAFYFKNITLDTTVYDDVHLKDGKYLTSTPYSLGGEQTFNGKQYMFIQNANVSDYGRVSLTEKKNQVKIRLFRRIYLS